ncbi:hypothetical protein FS749_002890 [Ceratobasidium sp. UAMH 11750]|nr:hypothetical protein FS749_002890 [Ceratobasidium sp. UAMH 11750]
MMLIRGARYTTVFPAQTRCIYLPEFLNKPDFSRFDLYARFVRQVTVCDDPKRCYPRAHRPPVPTPVDSILNWQSLLDYASDKVLLPNLTRVVCLESDYQSSLNWLSVLLSPSVRRVGFVNNEARWPLGSPSHPLAQIASKSPDLEALDLYRDRYGAYPTGGESWHSISAYQETLIESFAAFRKLRRLNGNLTLLYPSALQVLGGLPCLRQLAVSVNDVPPLEYSTALPDDSFPSLQALSITGIKSASWIMSLWCIEPLVSRLEDIHLDIRPQDLAQSGLNESWADDFLLQICDSSPQIFDIRKTKYPFQHLRML